MTDLAQVFRRSIWKLIALETVIVMLVGTGYYHLRYRPRLDYLSRMTARGEASIKGLYEALDQTSHEKDLVIKLLSRMNSTVTASPSTSEAASLAMEESKKYGMEFLSLSPTPSARAGEYTKKRMSFRFLARFADAVRFL
ncbi:MAG: hypothetical protein KAI64_05895, partial [Thermoplasmata archaeon]|nr:hypothetical protein [Thermoplasmata archaeon]